MSMSSWPGIPALILALGAGTASGAETERQRVPVLCGSTVSGVVQQLPCRDYDLKIFREKVLSLFQKQKFSSDPVERQREQIRFVKSHRAFGICAFTGVVWERGFFSLDTYQRMDGAPDVKFVRENTCDSGITMQVPEDDMNQLGPNVRYLAKRFNALKTAKDPETGDFYTYVDSTDFKQFISPNDLGDRVPRDCSRQGTGGTELQRLPCVNWNPNGDEYCHAKYFPSPSPRFPYKGWWWVRGPNRTNLNDEAEADELVVCSGGISVKDGAKLAKVQQKVVQDTRTSIMTGAEFTTKYADRIFDATTGEPLDVSEANITNSSFPGFRYVGITKCLAPNPAEDKETWYECNWSTMTGWGKQHMHDGALSTSTLDINRNNGSVTDERHYFTARHEHRRADCLVRRPVTKDFTYRFGNRDFRVWADVDASGKRMKLSKWRDDEDSQVNNALSTSLDLKEWGPFSPKNDFSPAIAIGQPSFRETPANAGLSRPVQVAPCSKVEVVWLRGWGPSGK